MSETYEVDYSKQIREINQALESGMFVNVRRMLEDMAPCDTALLLESTPLKSRNVLWQLVDPDLHGEILEELSEDVRTGIVRQMDPEKLAAATEDMDDDDLAELLRNLPERVYQQVMDSMDTQDRLRAERALSFSEDTAGALMNTDTITVRPDVTIDVILRYLRLKGELPEATDYLYVVSRNDVLIGEIALSAIVTSAPEKMVRQVMEKDIEAIPVDMHESDVAQLFERHNWISAPVVNEDGKLVGRITIDDIVDVIREDAEHSLLSMAGLEDEEDTFAPVIKSTKRRSLWLGINLITALAAAFVASFFENTLDVLPVLAVLNAIVPSMGGVAGSQTLTLVVRAMALGHVNDANARSLVNKELAIGTLNGVIWAIFIAGVVALWKMDWFLGLVIAFAMFMNLMAAGLAGVLVPLVLKRMKIDPALAGSVVLTTVTDIVGIFAFLGTATWLLLP